MRQTVYMSLASANFAADVLGNIVSVSRERNSIFEITGLLLYDGFRFLQALEGEDDVIDDTMMRIEADVRHRDIIYVSRRTVADRQFGSWSMAFRSSSGHNQHDEFVSAVKEHVKPVTDPSLKATFIGFASLSLR